MSVNNTFDIETRNIDSVGGVAAACFNGHHQNMRYFQNKPYCIKFKLISGQTCYYSKFCCSRSYWYIPKNVISEDKVLQIN